MASSSSSKTTGQPSRTSMPYLVPQRRQGRPRSPPQIPSYIMHNPRLWPYATGCMEADRDWAEYKQRLLRRPDTNPTPPKASQHGKPDAQKLLPMQSPSSMPYRYRSHLNPSQLSQVLTWLPTPPDPTHPYWAERCFECFAHGHQSNRCNGPAVCRNCLKQGHRSKLCPNRKQHNATPDILRPRGAPYMPTNTPPTDHH
jgi:hypothetical protein